MKLAGEVRLEGLGSIERGERAHERGGEGMEGSTSLRRNEIARRKKRRRKEGKKKRRNKNGSEL